MRTLGLAGSALLCALLRIRACVACPIPLLRAAHGHPPGDRDPAVQLGVMSSLSSPAAGMEKYARLPGWNSLCLAATRLYIRDELIRQRPEAVEQERGTTQADHRNASDSDESTRARAWGKSQVGRGVESNARLHHR